MRSKILIFTLVSLLTLFGVVSNSFAADPYARQIRTKTTNFDNNLSTADTDVQKALETLDEVVGGGGGGAPTNATYITQTVNGDLSAEQALSGLTTGILKNTTGTGVLSIASAGSDYVIPAGNVATATALASDPAGCSANQFANEIVASGNLSCSAIADADVPDGITITLASTATALASNPSDCSANQFANAIAASGNLTCGSIADADVPDTITINNAGAVENTDLGTLSDGKVCTYDLTGTEIDCNTTMTTDQVGTLTDTKWCTTDGSVVNCTSNQPVLTETDPTALLTAGTDNVKDTHIDWGAGAGQVSSDDVTEGSTNKFASLTNIQSACTNDFHNIGGTDDDVPEAGDFGALTFSKSFIITNPTASSDSSIWKVPYGITISAVHLLCRGNVVVGHLTEQDANGGADAGVDGATDITGIVDTNVNDDGSLSNPSIDANDYVGWRTTSVTGTPTKAIVMFDYTKT